MASGWRRNRAPPLFAIRHSPFAIRYFSPLSFPLRLRMDRQRVQLTAHVRQLDAALRSAEQAWRGQLLDWPTYLAIRSNVLSADLDLLDFHQRQATAIIALQALLGNTDLPVARKPQP